MSVATCDRCSVEIESMAEVGYMGPINRDSLKCYAGEKFITLCRECNLRHPDWKPPRGKRRSNAAL